MVDDLRFWNIAKKVLFGTPERCLNTLIGFIGCFIVALFVYDNKAIMDAITIVDICLLMLVLAKINSMRY